MEPQPSLASAIDHRSDLVRRMFAVVVSVGFAGALARSAWIEGQRFPKGDEWQSLLCLGAVLVLILSSWEGFNRHRAKTDTFLPVFCVDLALVLLYLVMLLLSSNPYALLRLVACVFLLYVVWDILVLRRFHERDSVRRCIISSMWCFSFLAITYLANPYAKPVFAAATVAVAALWFRARSMRSISRTLLGICVIAGVHALSWMT
jgi:hypothetical protein